ncbi:MAG: hypothetical protein H7070_13985 [Saprospiraceae bacterium]|nr:hypothetical protein [Pyrinomonadaceae bacterium]
MANQSKFSRRTIALFWMALLAVIIGVLIYLEQIAILYVLATLSLVVLLLIVAFADLEGVDRQTLEGFAQDSE